MNEQTMQTLNDLDHLKAVRVEAVRVEAVRVELRDEEIEAVSGGVSDLGKYITKAVDEAISAAIGRTGIRPL